MRTTARMMIGAVLAGVAAAQSAQAALLGDTISYDDYFPDTATPYGNDTETPGTFVVGPGVDSVLSVDGNLIDVDFDDTSVVGQFEKSASGRRGIGA